MTITALHRHILPAPDTRGPHRVSHFIVPRASDVLDRVQADEPKQRPGLGLTHSEAAVRKFGEKSR